MTDKIGTLIIDVEGTVLTPEDKELLAHPAIGGVIFFARNFASDKQMTALTTAIRGTRKQPLLLMVDQEGGRVQRFKDTFTRLPAMGLIGTKYNEAPEEAWQLAKACGFVMAYELLKTGIDFSLAPVLDLNKNQNQVIGDRAFHHDPHIVTTLAEALIQGMEKAGMGAVIKHFPGHGHVTVDSHESLPVDARTLPEIMRSDMVPFQQLIQTGVPAIMAAHILFPHIDSLPIGYSQTWLQTILRDQLRFQGVIFSDDLNMEGANISAHYEDRFEQAKNAGCDFILLCNNRKAVIQALDRSNAGQSFIAKEKWGKLQGQFAHVFSDQANTEWQQSHEKILCFMQKTLTTFTH